MFQSSKLVEHLHHFYLIQALIIIQRRCNRIYTSLKHKLIFLVNKRLILSRIKGLVANKRGLKHTLNSSACYEEENYFLNGPAKSSSSVGGGDNSTNNNNFFQDLNRLLINPSQAAVSIPMLLIPFLVQPHGAERTLGSSSSLSSSSSCYIYHNNNNNNSNKGRGLADNKNQQWQLQADSKNNNVRAQNQYITLIPSQMITSQSQSIIGEQQQLHGTFMTPEQRRNYQQPFVNSVEDANYLHSRSSWSSSATNPHQRSTNPACGLTMRNPLINNAANKRIV